MEKFTLELLVINKFGVLNRITGLYARRGYNIDSLSVSETVDPKYSRMFIVAQGDIQTQKQMVRQLQKLYDIIEVTLMTRKTYV